MFNNSKKRSCWCEPKHTGRNVGGGGYRNPVSHSRRVTSHRAPTGVTANRNTGNPNTNTNRAKRFFTEVQKKIQKSYASVKNSVKNSVKSLSVKSVSKPLITSFNTGVSKTKSIVNSQVDRTKNFVAPKISKVNELSSNSLKSLKSNLKLNPIQRVKSALKNFDNAVEWSVGFGAPPTAILAGAAAAVSGMSSIMAPGQPFSTELVKVNVDPSTILMGHAQSQLQGFTGILNNPAMAALSCLAFVSMKPRDNRVCLKLDEMHEQMYKDNKDLKEEVEKYFLL